MNKCNVVKAMSRLRGAPSDASPLTVMMAEDLGTSVNVDDLAYWLEIDDDLAEQISTSTPSDAITTLRVVRDTLPVT